MQAGGGAGTDWADAPAAVMKAPSMIQIRRRIAGLPRSRVAQTAAPRQPAFDERLPRRLPAPSHDVTDLPHAPAVGIGDTGIVAARVAVREEPRAGALEERALRRSADGNGATELRRHLAVQRRQAGIGAD